MHPYHIGTSCIVSTKKVMELFQGKYRIESARLKEWDYTNPWWYYVTINTKNHIEWFGRIRKGKMELNKLGNLVEDEWLKTKEIRKNVDLDYYVIMPNHVHGIIIINPVQSYKQNVETPYMASLPLGEIVGKYKAAVTRWCHKYGNKNFSWQARFYDRIIRNEKELYHIRKYISENPLRWEIDRDVPENLEM